MWTATKKLASGNIAYYAYAWKGGPLIAKGVGLTKIDARADLERILGLPETMAKLALAREAQDIRPAPSHNYIGGLVTAFVKSPEFGRLAPRTKSDYRKHLDGFAAEFGDWKTRLFDDPSATQDLAEWRDEHPSPRQGHMRLQVVSRLFSWGRSRGLTKANPTEPIQRVYKADRSDAIWSKDDLAAVLTHSTDEMRWAIKLALYTGLRQGDLLRLPWSAVSDLSIQWKTSKRDKHTIIPITPPLRELLSDIPKRSPVILTSALKRPWTADGLKSSFGRAKKRAGIKDLRWHDLRGTAVTQLIKTSLTQRDIARIIGWSETKIEAILERYVSADAVAEDMLKRMSAEQNAQTDDKPVGSENKQ
ncbi:MAG: tyrosine-type recombinase/integrase [Pseudomonadota bacterium]